MPLIAAIGCGAILMMISLGLFLTWRVVRTKPVNYFALAALYTAIGGIITALTPLLSL